MAMLMATSRTSQRRRASTTDPGRATPAGILVVGTRATELRALERAFEGRGVLVSVARTKEEARHLLARQRWLCVLLDARWELELCVDAALQAERVRCYLPNPTNAPRGYQAIPLGQSDVDEILAWCP